MRLARNAWLVPCRIDLTDAGWQATVDETVMPADPDPAVAERVADIWHGGFVVDESIYNWCLGMKAWAAQHDPEHPCLQPTKAISHNRLRPL